MLGGLVYEQYHLSIKPSGAGQGNLDGFISINEPQANTNYLGFDETSYIPAGNFSEPGSSGTQGRYALLPRVRDMGLPCLYDDQLNPMEIQNWSQLVKMRVVWIAGNNTNGGDRPDVHTWLPGGYPRKRENFYVALHNSTLDTVCEQFIWNVHNTTEIQPPGLGVLSYPNDSFVDQTFEFSPECLAQAEWVRFYQPRHTWKLDNYAIKWLELEFEY